MHCEPQTHEAFGRKKVIFVKNNILNIKTFHKLMVNFHPWLVLSLLPETVGFLCLETRITCSDPSSKSCAVGTNLLKSRASRTGNRIQDNNLILMNQTHTSAYTSFRTEIPMNKLIHPQILMNDTICLIGSCFAENINNKLVALKFQTDVNPFGIVYNPVSISHGLRALLDSKKYGVNDLQFDGEKWFSYSHHTCFSGRDVHACLQMINDRIQHGRSYLCSARVLFLTLGSAWAYKHRETKTVRFIFFVCLFAFLFMHQIMVQIVANCHKQPNHLFEKVCLSVDGMASELLETMKILLSENPKITVVITVSPVRHWKDGGGEVLSSRYCPNLFFHRSSSAVPGIHTIFLDS